MKRWIVRLFAGLLAALAVIAVLAWLTVRASLPQLDGVIETDGIAASVSIKRDAAGIPTITASNRLDLAFATGFVHGQDRFFQMDLIRRDAAGELSEIVGSATIQADRGRRLHRFRSRAVKALGSLSELELQVLRHYSMGVNEGLAGLGSKPFEYYVLGVDPKPWAAEDSLLVAYAMFLDLNYGRASHDTRRGVAATILPPDVIRWLYPPGSPWDAPMQGEPSDAAPVPGPEIFSLRNVTVTAGTSGELGQPPVLGSNNWAVSGDLTASGRAMVTNDMHLGINVPNIYYRARLVSTGSPAVTVSGVSLPGQPLIIAGSSGQVAWGFTNSNGDWSDAVLIRSGEQPGTYRTPDGDQEFEIHNEIIEVKDADNVDYEVRETIWGPVDDNANFPDGEIAVSWIAHHTEAVNLGILQLESAATVHEALDIANRTVMPPQNFVVGDDNGNIAWTISGQIPLRGDYDAGSVADWSVTEGWQGWLPADRYPRIVNPDSGRIWSANSRVVDGDALHLIGDGGYAFGARATQIRDSLFAKDQFAPKDMLAIQFDDRALFLAGWQSLLLSVLDNADESDPVLAEYRQLVENWIPRAVPESIGYRLVRAFRNEVRQSVFDAIMTPVRNAYGDDVNLLMSRQFDGPLWTLVTEQPEHFLPAGYATWNDFLLEAVRENIRYYNENFDGPLADRSWGEYNTANIRHQLSRAVPMLSRWLDMPADPLNGDADMPKAQGPTWGASERFSVFPGDEKNSLLHMPGGQSGHPMSDFYRRGHDDWVQGRPTAFLPGASQYELILQPATR
ncbi:MAG: penicillin acylase family protein [Woeseiaceae bacterium]